MATEPKLHPSKHCSALCQFIIYGVGTEAFRAVLKALWVGLNQMSSLSFMKGVAALHFSKTHFTASLEKEVLRPVSPQVSIPTRALIMCK